MKKLLKVSGSITLKNWTTLLTFELFYKVVCYSFLSSIVGIIMDNILHAAGITYLSFENIRILLTHPLSIVLFLCLIMIITVSTFFEVSALYIYCEKGWRNEFLSLWQLIKKAFKSCRALLNIKILLFFWGFMLGVLLAVSPFSRYVLGWRSMPEFIMDFIWENQLFRVLFIIILIGLNYLFILCLFVLPSVILYKKDFRASWQECFVLLRKRKAATLWKFVVSFTVLFAVFFLIFFSGAGALAAYAKPAYALSQAEAAFRFRMETLGRIGIILASTISTIWLFAMVLSLFHEYRNDIRPNRVHTKPRLFSIIRRVIVMAATVFLVILFSETELGGNFIYSDDLSTQIIAHRAASAFAPENTMAALNYSIEAKADAAEIDVQLLKDNTLIILHDSNFKRTTGVDKNVWDTNYSEVRGYDAGSFFSDDFAKEPVPTLDEMLKTAKNKINLMIELKLTGHEQRIDLVKQTLEQIRKYDMVHQCSIASMNLEILKEAKQMESQIETVYITPLLYSHDYGIDYIDGYSVETTSITTEMVMTANYQGKKIFGWTANSENTIQRNLRCKVNGIITDNPELTRYYVDEQMENLTLNLLTDLFFPDSL